MFLKMNSQGKLNLRNIKFFSQQSISFIERLVRYKELYPADLCNVLIFYFKRSARKAVIIVIFIGNFYIIFVWHYHQGDDVVNHIQKLRSDLSYVQQI